MRENESDGEGGWSQPHEYVSPWAPRDEGEDGGPAGRSRARLPRRRTAIRTPSPSALRRAHLPAMARAPRSPATETSQPTETRPGTPSGTEARTVTRSRETAGMPRATTPAAVTARRSGPRPIPRRDVPAAAGASWSISSWPRSRPASAPGLPWRCTTTARPRRPGSPRTRFPDRTTTRRAADPRRLRSAGPRRRRSRPGFDPAWSTSPRR